MASDGSHGGALRDVLLVEIGLEEDCPPFEELWVEVSRSVGRLVGRLVGR